MVHDVMHKGSRRRLPGFLPSRGRFVLAAILLLLPALSFAHPHMFLTSKAEFVWDGARLSGCFLEWTFDQFFSADLMSYDANGDGVFSAAETKAVYDGAFSNLKNYYYFTFIRQGSKRMNPPGVGKFSVLRRGERVAYRFFIDLSKTEPGEIALAVYDYTFFCDIRSAETEPVKLTYDGALVKPSYSIAENRDYPVYYNPLGAVDDTTVYYTWRKGLQTYYPREIRIVYE
jgi:ABC-type uncharacterized transport system substrate-binding protein